jgi:hypothetical protein
MNTAVPMPDGETRWISEEERARIARTHHAVTSSAFMSYTPTAAEVLAADREAERRQRDARMVEASEQRARVRAATDRRRFLPRLTDAVARGIEAALLHRCDPRYPAPAAARRWLDAPLREIAVEWLTMAGDAPARDHHRLAMAWLQRGGQAQQTWQPAANTRGYLATSDLPLLLDNVAHVLYLDAYTDTPRTFTAWTRELEVPDFRSTVVVTPSFPALLPVPEHAEYTDHGALGPTAALRLVTYGREVTITRPCILADDLLTFGQLQQALGVAAGACESDATYNLLVSNPVLADGNALFSAPHKNLMTASDLTAAALTTAAAALASQTAADGRALHLRARYLVVGTLLGAEARQLVTSMTPVNSSPEDGLVVVEDDRIPAKSWYLMTDQWPTIATAHLAAAGGPELMSKDGWDVDGRLYKARDEFGCTVMDWRSMVFTPTT